MNHQSALCEKLIHWQPVLPQLVLDEHLLARPDLAASYTERQKKLYREDVSYILSFLSEAISAGRPELFVEFAVWLRTFLQSVNVPPEDVKESLLIIEKIIKKKGTDEENQVVSRYMAPAIKLMGTTTGSLTLPETSSSFTALARQYLSLVLEGNRMEAQKLILNQVREGKPVREIYLDVFQPVQYEIGRLWQTNKISVAQEHYITGVTQLIMSQLYPYLFTGEKKDRKLVSTCVSGELHEIGIRMVTDFFEMSGWDTYYLGANTPRTGVIGFLERIKPELLAISTTMTFHLSEVVSLIDQVKANPELKNHVKIIVGGYPFKVAKNLWHEIGADGFATDAEQAIKQAEMMIHV